MFAATLGIFAHAYYWVTSASGDYIYNNPRFKASNSEEGLAIYCVHGTADRPRAFSRIAERLLMRLLPENISSINLIAFDGRYQGNSIEFFAEQLVKKMIANGHSRVVLKGHSRGGLVCAYAAEYLAAQNAIKVEAVITIGTPFKGSSLALPPLSWFSSSVKQMEVASEFLNQLKARVLDSAVRYFFTVADDDYIVDGGSSSIAEYVQKNPDSLIKLDTSHGHLSVMSSHQLVSKIHAIISSYAPAQVINSGQAQFITSGVITEDMIIEDYMPASTSTSPAAKFFIETESAEPEEEEKLNLFEGFW